MPSQYTPSLEIQQMGNGEDSNTWGTITNNNWQYMEYAVAGVVNIAMSNANRTLNTTNGSSNESRYMVLNVTGSNSAVYQVIAPLQPKFYIISNNTSGGYAIQIAATGGSTVVTIPSGATAQVYCDGSTGFFSAQTGSAGNFLVNGNLTVTGSSTETGNLSAAGALSAYTAATSTASSISGTTLTIGGTLTGTFFVGQIISGTGVTSGTTITALGSGTGGAGTYTVSVSQTVSSTAINGAVGVSLNNPYIPGPLSVGGNASITGTLSVTGTSTLGGNTAITGTLSTTGDGTFSGTGQVKLPVGTTAQRSALPLAGMIRYNSTTGFYESYSTVAGQTISSITYITTTATLTTSTAHGLTTGNVVTITGATPAAYNGTFVITVTGTTTFTYTMASNPGANATVVGSYVSGSWGQIGGVTGLVAGGVVYENGQTISSNYTMTTGNNGVTAGPVTVNTGIVVTIPTGSRWVIV